MPMPRFDVVSEWFPVIIGRRDTYDLLSGNVTAGLRQRYIDEEKLSTSQRSFHLNLPLGQTVWNTGWGGLVVLLETALTLGMGGVNRDYLSHWPGSGNLAFLIP